MHRVAQVATMLVLENFEITSNTSIPKTEYSVPDTMPVQISLCSLVLNEVWKNDETNRWQILPQFSEEIQASNKMAIMLI